MRLIVKANVYTECYLSEENEEKIYDYAKEQKCTLIKAVNDILYDLEGLYDNSQEVDFITNKVTEVLDGNGKTIESDYFVDEEDEDEDE